MCGKVINVKLKLIKALEHIPEAIVGQIYEPYWYRNHDMNRSPCETVVYFSRGKDENPWAADLSFFEEAK